MATKSYCSLKYHKFPRPDLALFANNVLDQYYTHPVEFPAVVVPINTFKAVIKMYITTLNAYKNGGSNQKDALDTFETALIGYLDEIAVDVDSAADGNPDVIVAGGYKPTKIGRTNYPVPPQPEIFTLKTIKGGGIIQANIGVLEKYGDIHYVCLCVEGAKLKEGQVKFVNGNLVIDPFIASNLIRISTTCSRMKTFKELEPGTEYYFYYYYENAEGCSDLSKAMMLKADHN